LTSPIDVLENTIGNSPLSMKIIFNGQDEGRVEFDVIPEDVDPTRLDPIQNLRGRRDSLEENMDGLSAEEARMLVGMQQRRAARASRDVSFERNSLTPEPETSRGPSWREGEFIPVQIDYE
jgi:hypothetical protein